MKQDLERIAQQAYHRAQWSSPLVRRYHREKGFIPQALTGRVEHLYRLFLAPMTLWPFNIQGFLERVLDAIKSRRKLDTAMELLFQVLPAVPNESTVAAVMAHEHDVQSGRYEHLVPGGTRIVPGRQEKICSGGLRTPSTSPAIRTCRLPPMRK